MMRRMLNVYTVFQDSPDPSWWDGLTRPGFRHCWQFYTIHYPAPGLCSNRFVSKVEYLRSHLDVDVWWTAPEQVTSDLYERGATAIVLSRVDVFPGMSTTVRGLMTCVSVCKATLSLQNWEIVTPYQLFRRLIHNGDKIARG